MQLPMHWMMRGALIALVALALFRCVLIQVQLVNAQQQIPTATNFCARRRDDPLHMPSDLQERTSPEETSQFGDDSWTWNLQSHPMEPGCWKADNVCAQFRCFKKCSSHVNYDEMMRYWAPCKPGKRKVLVFQYGKVASRAIVKGLKLYAGISAAHVTAENAKQWKQLLECSRVRGMSQRCVTLGLPPVRPE